MVDRVYESGAVASPPSAPASPSSGYPTAGNPATALPATKPGPYWFHMVTESLRNVVSASGITPDHTDLTQLTQAIQAIVNAQAVPAGAEVYWPHDTPPTGWFEEDGSARSMTLYESLYNVIRSQFGLGAGVTFSADSGTDTLTAVAHGLSDDDVIEVTNSGGALPAGLSATTKYYVINATTDAFQLSLAKGGAAVDFTDNGSGTQYFHTEFLLPDARGEFVRAWDHGRGVDAGRSIGTDQLDQMQRVIGRFSVWRGVVTAGTTGAFSSASGSLSNRPNNGATVDMDVSFDSGNSPGARVSATTDGETRPRNTSRMLIIKY